jgi:hypothetical protein
VRIQLLGTILDDLAGANTLDRSGDVENARFDATRAQTAPVRLSQAQDERLFRRIVRLRGLAEAAETGFVFVVVLRLLARLRCLPASVVGPPFRALRPLAARRRSDAIRVPFLKKWSEAPCSLLARSSHTRVRADGEFWSMSLDTSEI